MADPGPSSSAQTESETQAAVQERLDSQLLYFSSASSRAKKMSQRFRVAELVVGSAVPVVAALEAPPVVTASLGAIVVVLLGIRDVYQWGKLSILYRSTLEGLKREKALYRARVGEYSDDDRDANLAARVEALITEDNANWRATVDTGTDNSGVGN